jgi:riboflavin biosynthesis pyrimidine reductase
MQPVLRSEPGSPELGLAGTAPAGASTVQNGSGEAPQDQRPVMLDYARIRQAADKIVYSSTLEAVSTARTRLERTFDLNTVRSLVASAERDVSIGGPTLARGAIRAGLVDEYNLFLMPVVVGGGVRSLPDEARLTLSLGDERRFASGVVYLRYRAVGAP